MKPKTSSLRHIFLMISVLAATLLFTGCGKLMEYGNTNSNTQPQRASTPAVAEQTNSAALPAASAVPGGPVLATSEGDLPGIRVELVELKRTSGDTVNLKFAMINDSDKELGFGYEFGEGTGDIGTIGATHLIDAAGKKKYFVVRDTEGACLCSRGISNIKPKTRATLFAKFPAPPGDVKNITVVIPHFTPMDDVPIS
jgi:hypothetical protein